MADAATDRNLLFGILALQADLIDQQQFVRACTLWSLSKDTPLAEVLLEQRWLTQEEKAHVDFLLERKLKKHAGNIHASLAALTDREVVQALNQIGNSTIQQTLMELSGPEPARYMPVETVAYQGGARERYQLTRLHATGGIGRVWLARDEDLGREVALKELLPEREGRPEVWARFQEEARITGQLEHPGIVPVYELVKGDGNKKPFYTMRFIRGRALSRAIDDYHEKRAAGKAGPMDMRELLGSFVAVCNAVAYAHSRRVLHRDLKPHNIVLGDFGEVIVLDWGLAKLMDQAEEASSLQPVAGGPAGSRDATIQGQVLGTPGYMPPEQAEGRLDLVERRSDVYGLGAILYDILANRPPFRGENSEEVLRQVVHQTPPPPRELIKETPSALEAICLKALAKRPADRYGSAKELAEDVQRFLADEPVSAYREPLAVQAGRWLRRHRTSVSTALVGVGVAVVALLTIAIVQAESRRRLGDKNEQLVQANAQIAEARDRAEHRVALAVGAIDSFRSAVDDNLDVKNRPENQALRTTLLQTPLAFYQKLGSELRAAADSSFEQQTELADAYYKLATLNREIGSQADALKEYAEAVAMLDGLVLAAPEPLRSSLRDRLARSLSDQGALQSVSQGQMEAALTSYGRARELLESQVRDEPASATHQVQLGRLLNNLATLEGQAGKTEAALATLSSGLSAAQEARRIEPDSVKAAVLLASLHRQAGHIMDQQKGRVREALASVKKAIEVVEPSARAHPDDMQAQLVLADCYGELAALRESAGEMAASVDDRRRQLAVIETMIHKRPTVSQYQLNRVSSLRELAATQRQLGQTLPALATLKQAQADAEKLIRDNPSNIQFKQALSNIFSSLAAAQYGLGQTADALASIEAGAVLIEQMSQADPKNIQRQRDLAGAEYNIALLSNQLGRITPALAAYGKSLELRQRLVREHPGDPRFPFDVATTLGNIANIEIEANRFPEARAHLENAVQIYEKLFRDHPQKTDYENYLARAQQNLALALDGLGQTEKALELSRKSVATSERLSAAQPKVLLLQADLATGLLNQGDYLRKTGKTAEAAAVFERAIAIREAMIKSDPGVPEYQTELANCLRGLGLTRRAAGQFRDAVALYRRAIMLAEKAPASGPRNYNLARSHALLSAAALDSGSGLSVADAAAEADKAMDLLRQTVAAGYGNPQALEHDTDLESLQKRDDFRKLLRELHKKDTPAQP